MQRLAVTPWLWLGYAGFIVYGSLLPFDFRPLGPAQAWALFQQTPFLQLGVDARADWVANGVLYAPLGALTARLLAGRRVGFARVAGLALAGALCALLAFAVEFTQLYFPPRTVSQNDLLAECVGSAVGIVAAPLLAPWWNRLRSTWLGDGRRVLQQLVQAYAAAYLLFCFFPFDLLLSAQEWHDKLHSDAWGWWVARPDGWSWPRALLQWIAEVALTMPFGWLLPGEQRRSGRQRPLLRAALTGALLGGVIEAGQLLIETGISQGVSVLSRAVGMCAGAWARQALAARGIEPLRRWLDRHANRLALAYGGLLTVVNGWWSHPWQGADGIAAALERLHLMPFYYHYYTSEAIALYSLCSVVALYLPLAALCWARQVPPGRAAALSAAAAALMEAGKLLLADTHPDPTNALIAGASCGLLLAFLRRWQRRLGAGPAAAAPGSAPQIAATAPASPVAMPHDHRWRRAWVLPVLPAALLGTLLLPLPAPALLLAFGVVGGGAAAVWWRPALLFAIVPAALPVFDLAQLSGRFFWDELDWLMAACLAVGWYRTPPPDTPSPDLRWRSPASTVAFGLVGAALAASTLRGLLPLSLPLDADAFAHYYSHFNALRIAKGAVWAWLFVACWRRLAARRPGGVADEFFGAGVRVGLALTVLVILYERAAFAGWFDFASDYRVSGPFSAMHKGGAYVECFLAVASAYALAPLLTRSGRAASAAAIVLFTGAAYGVMVTFSRNGHAAFTWVIAAFLVVAGWRGHAGPRRRAALLGAVGLAAAIGAAVLSGPYARERLSHVVQDLRTRQAHWHDALAMRDDDAATQLFGTGLGRFPETHFWRSREALHAASFRLAHGDGNRGGAERFLRLGSGATVYIEQIVNLPPGGALTLQGRLRSTPGGVALRVTLCRKWLLTSKDCARGALTASAAAPTDSGWQPAALSLPPLPPSASRWRVPVKLSLLTPAAGTVLDVTDLRLLDGAGVDHLANGDFAAGMDRWFFTTDFDPPWHVHNLAVAILFEQGWFGLLAWALLLAMALALGGRAARAGDVTVLPAVIGLGAFLISGSLNTLIDAPRFLWLLLVLAWRCAAKVSPTRADSTPRE